MQKDKFPTVQTKETKEFETIAAGICSDLSLEVKTVVGLTLGKGFHFKLLYD